MRLEFHTALLGRSLPHAAVSPLLKGILEGTGFVLHANALALKKKKQNPERDRLWNDICRNRLAERYEVRMHGVKCHCLKR